MGEGGRCPIMFEKKLLCQATFIIVPLGLTVRRSTCSTSTFIRIRLTYIAEKTSNIFVSARYSKRGRYPGVVGISGGGPPVSDI